MAFSTKQGYRISENGWRMCNAAELDRTPVPGTKYVLPFRKGDAHTVLSSAASRLHFEVQKMDMTQCGSFTDTNDVGNSNHNSGTAFDFNWRKHQFRVRGTWGNLIGGVRKILSDFRGCLWYGGDWTSPIDEMHFQLNYAEGDKRITALAADLRGGLWGIWKPGDKPTPYTPLPADANILEIGSFGEDVRRLQSELNRVFPRYSHLVADGEFGPLTAAVVTEFQDRAGLTWVDGQVGPETRAALKKYGVKL